jgi:electron transport complex protein RnfC
MPAGIRLERKKEASLLNWNLKRPYPPEKIRISIPNTSSPCVKSGDKIQTGQKIAVPATAHQEKIKDGAGAEVTEGVTVHAGMCGMVEKVSVFPDALGGESLMIEIRRQGEPKTLPPPELRKGWEELTAKELLWIFQYSGLVTTDPQMEPIHAKLLLHAGAKTLIINLCEPEPYITCEQVLAMAQPMEILKGAELLRKSCGAERIIFAAEKPNLELVELIRSKVYFLKWEHVEVRTVPAFYPQGLESTLLQAWFPGREEEAVVVPASTAFAAYEAVALEKPFYERVVTVGGECVVEPRSLWLPLGISFHDAIRACKGVMRQPGKVLMGGPMAGIAQSSLEVPMMAGTNAILGLPPEVVREEAEEPCIRCNRCVDSCPVSLSPVMITLAAEQNEFEISAKWGASDCIECGNCAFVCPSKRPMLELIRLARLRAPKVVIRG